ncbi:putative modification methylase [Roseobacter sp. AzwK-3b]|nr:putative modification methylase [Roseobacter sp. AzwK-3b]
MLDPTCGSGATAYVAEQWGRRWITIDTSRVALALARARIMGAKYPWYILKDSEDPSQQGVSSSLVQHEPDVAIDPRGPEPLVAGPINPVHAEAWVIGAHL